MRCLTNTGRERKNEKELTCAGIELEINDFMAGGLCTSTQVIDLEFDSGTGQFFPSWPVLDI